MSAQPTTRKPALSRLALASVGAILSAAIAGAPAAVAQSSTCQEFPKVLQERQDLIKRVNGLGKKPNAKDACALFTKLNTNGTTALKWLDLNKDWCQVPDSIAEGFKADHERVSKFKTQACQVAAKAEAMEKKARQQAQQGGGGQGGLLGGGGLTGSYKMPQGAL
jgi:hypothetical protein